jgi:hypothetical protein
LRFSQTIVGDAFHMNTSMKGDTGFFNGIHDISLVISREILSVGDQFADKRLKSVSMTGGVDKVMVGIEERYWKFPVVVGQRRGHDIKKMKSLRTDG